jgi:hypothetical protein
MDDVMMTEKPIEEGDLLAYLNGEHLPHVEAALAASPDLRIELEALRRTNHMLSNVLGGLDTFDSQDIVDVITGQATDGQQLRVAASVRQDAQVRAEFEALQQAFQTAAPASRHPESGLSRFFAVPLSGMAGLRAAAPAAADVPLLTPGKDQSFLAADLNVQITLHLVPPAPHYWQIEGHVTHDQAPAPELKVTLTSEATRPRPRQTDDMGFFSFRRLRAGTYRLQVFFAQGIVVLPDIHLHDE